LVLINQVIAVVIDENNESKVFVVFESGLLTFIDGIVRLTVAATPADLLAGDAPDAWNKAWDRHKADTKNLDGLREIGTDLRTWVAFLKRHNDRKGLAYLGLQGMMPMEARIVGVVTVRPLSLANRQSCGRCIERPGWIGKQPPFLANLQKSEKNGAPKIRLLRLADKHETVT
jgi:hypothetical protein